MCPQCVSLFLLVIENYDMGVRYTALRWYPLILAAAHEVLYVTDVCN